MRPRLLDLFCGAGGAGMGYHRAGFDVTGVDNRPQKHYPFPFLLGDALEYVREHGREYDAIHASPPCQAYSAGARMRNGYAKVHPRLIEPLRELLLTIGTPYVVENVPGAPLLSPITFCGSNFGLQVRRHRDFESSVVILSNGCHHESQPIVVGVYGDHPEDSVIRKGHPAIRARSVRHAAEAMGIDWMETWYELKEAIPPAYTEWIGKQLMQVVQAQVR